MLTIKIIINNHIKAALISLLLGGSLSLLSGCSSQSKKVDSISAASINAKLGASYLQMGRLKLANTKLQKALKQNSNSSEVHHSYALLKQKIGDNKAASIHFEKAISISQKDPSLLNNYGSHLCQTGHYLKAVKQFDLASQSPFYKTPEYAYTNAGICLRKTQNDKTAEHYFRKALNKNTNFGSALFQMAKLNYDQSSYAKAQAFLLRYDENNLPAVESLELCTKINKQLGDTDKADHCAEKKLRLFSK
ncbi:MAG: type IV pilus biogenesis/stability protein PilW [Cocleimonas sp.]|nr:type IV pilus biogenesis/stability protein PilW [Cocleimonas sp.]